jgi:hypothetical protein
VRASSAAGEVEQSAEGELSSFKLPRQTNLTKHLLHVLDPSVCLYLHTATATHFASGSTFLKSVGDTAWCLHPAPPEASRTAYGDKSTPETADNQTKQHAW